LVRVLRESVGTIQTHNNALIMRFEGIEQRLSLNDKSVSAELDFTPCSGRKFC